MLTLTVAAAVASVAAIFLELINVSGMPRGDQTLHLALAVGTIVLSWAYIHVAFALHYAHEFYDEDARSQPCLGFPGTDEPGYLDFLYFSFVIGMTSQTADVEVASSSMRGLVADSRRDHVFLQHHAARHHHQYCGRVGLGGWDRRGQVLPAP